MRVSNIISISAIGASGVLAQNATGQLGDAAVQTGNPIGLAVKATLPEDPFWTGSINGNVKGSLTATSGAGGVGVDYEVSFSNLPTEGGPFIYHIHVAPVPENGNCTSTLAHLDQYIRGEDPACDITRPESCQQGDLSGKYGHINGSAPFTAKYNDPYTSLVEGAGAYIANRSVVFHFANKTRISCANFSVLSTNGTLPASPTSYPTGGSGSGSSTSTPSPSSTVPLTGAAGVLNVVKNFAIAPVVVAFLALM
ncbi:superoxide dismutase [Hypoxylon rubiginosum]|uniref:Superoxide dismutase n=1 Tax=Hypoxylon rubiginosum TaxID=110542 RepID=A0ACB9YQP0_9PEZI|nr:superoxide dismutase [Hypoxylon rubiginosum]